MTTSENDRPAENTIKVATWNVNSVRARHERLLRWLESHRPDVLCLQEIKVTEDLFPALEVRERGYYSVVLGQKTYNGVAILSRTEPTNVRTGFGGDDDADAHARLLSADIEGITVYSAYFPNGSTVTSDKFVYKLSWMAKLRDMLRSRHRESESVLLCGDFNVAPRDQDVARVDEWKDSVLCVPQVRTALQEIANIGLCDVVAQHYPDGGVYSWWDYRMLGFPKGNGLRIDHIFATPPVADRCTAAGVDRDERKGKQPSDHAPVWAEFSRS